MKTAHWTGEFDSGQSARISQASRYREVSPSSLKLSQMKSGTQGIPCHELFGYSISFINRIPSLLITHGNLAKSTPEVENRERVSEQVKCVAGETVRGQVPE